MNLLCIFALVLNDFVAIQHQKICLHGGGSHHQKKQRKNQQEKALLTHYTGSLSFHLKVNLLVDQEGLEDGAVTHFLKKGLSPERNQGHHHLQSMYQDARVLPKGLKPNHFPYQVCDLQVYCALIQESVLQESQKWKRAPSHHHFFHFQGLPAYGM